MLLDVQEKIKMKKREELLAKNPWKISAPTEKNKRWTSYVPDPSKPSGRKQIRRSTKEAVEDIIIAYWKEQILQSKMYLIDGRNINLSLEMYVKELHRGTFKFLTGIIQNSVRIGSKL